MKKKNNPEGQLSFWDIEVPKTTNNVVEKIEKITEDVIKATKSVTEITNNQQRVIDKYKILDELNRVVHYAGSGVGIELKYDNEFKTIYVNRAGEEEFVTSSQVPVQPIDRIIVAKNTYEINEVQKNRLEDLKQKHNLKSYIKRVGDKNIIIKVDEKVIAINPQGWLLEYSEAIYQEDEIVNLENITIEYTVGDMVEAIFGNEKVVGKIVKEYENQDSYNIIWDRKHSAFHKSKILRKVS